MDIIYRINGGALTLLSNQTSPTNIAGTAGDSVEVWLSEKQTATVQAAGFTESSVTFDGSDYLSRASGISSVNEDNLLMFLSFTVGTVGTEQTVWASGSTNMRTYLTTTGTLTTIIRNTTPQSTTSNLTGVVSGDRIFVLISCARNGSMIPYYKVNTGAWTAGSTTSIGDFPMETNVSNFVIGARHAFSVLWNGQMQRVAFWAGLATLPDITSSTVRDWFVTSSHTIENPATSVANIKALSGNSGMDPKEDIYGAASVWNAGTNYGSRGSYTVTGAVVDV